MKKTALVFAALFALPAIASAQTATINVSATVQSAVSFSNTTDFSFGAAITPGTGATVAPADGGKSMVTYNVPTTVSVSGTSLVNGGASLPVSYSCAQDASGTSAAPTAFAGTCAAGFTTSLSGNAQSSHWIYVGGAIAAASTASAPAGVYAGTVTLTASYTSY